MAGEQNATSSRVSEILSGLAAEGRGGRVPLGDIIDILGERAFGLLQLVFSLPNAIGLGAVPGLSTVFGLPQIVLALQMIAGLEHPWLPTGLRRRSIARRDLVTVCGRALPYLVRAERVLKPRLLPLSSHLAERLLGVVFLILAIIVSLPIPLGNQPPALAMALLSVGLIERDGVFLIIGLIVGLLAVAIATLVVAAGAMVISVLLHQLLGG